jgi:hypothetical protein
MESSFVLTDSDLEEIETLKKKYNVNLTLSVNAEQLTALSAGTLFVTSKRLLFSGDSRNTTISLKKIVDGHVFSDCVRIEKSAGKPDLFSMNAAQARFVLSLVGVLKEH